MIRSSGDFALQLGYASVIMLPDAVKKVIASSPGVMLGSRNGDNQPSIHRCFGVHAVDDGHIDVFVRNPTHLADNLADNGQLALNINHTGNHETYQIKGEHTASRTPTGADLERFASYKIALTNALTGMGYPAPVIDMYIQPPSLIVTMDVREIYLQTPGPNAGNRLYPEP